MLPKSTREESAARAVTRAAIYMPFAHISRQAFALGSFSMNISHLLQHCLSVSINVNHIPLWAMFWLAICLTVSESLSVLLSAS